MPCPHVLVFTPTQHTSYSISPSIIHLSTYIILLTGTTMNFEKNKIYFPRIVKLRQILKVAHVNRQMCHFHEMQNRRDLADKRTLIPDTIQDEGS